MANLIPDHEPRKTVKFMKQARTYLRGFARELVKFAQSASFLLESV